MAAAFAARLVEATEGVRVPRTHGAGALAERVVEVQLPAPPPMTIERPLRSG